MTIPNLNGIDPRKAFQLADTKNITILLLYPHKTFYYSLRVTYKIDIMDINQVTLRFSLKQRPHTNQSKNIPYNWNGSS